MLYMIVYLYILILLELVTLFKHANDLVLLGQTGLVRYVC